QVLAGRFVAFSSRRPRCQTHERGRKALHQTQGLIQRKASRARSGRIKVMAMQFHDAEDRMHRKLPVGVRFFASTAGVVRDGELGLGVELFEQTAAVFEQGFAQPQLDGFTVANPVALQIPASQSQEGFGFLELLVGQFLRLEFFLRPESCDSKRVISSLSVTYSSARVWK